MISATTFCSTVADFDVLVVNTFFQLIFPFIILREVFIYEKFFAKIHITSSDVQRSHITLSRSTEKERLRTDIEIRYVKAEPKKKQRKRNITYYNPPFNAASDVNLGK